jgi:hypothetical protein
MTSTVTSVTIIINRQEKTFDHTILLPQEFKDAVNAPGDYEVWKVVGTPDPTGALPVDDVQVTQRIEVKDREHFRVVPPGTFG